MAITSAPVQRRRFRIDPTKRLIFAGALVATSLLAGACGTSSNSRSNSSSSSGGGAAAPVAPGKQEASPTSAVAATTQVAIDTFMFSPHALHVRVGDTVTWTNKDSILHTVTSGTRDYEPGNSGHVTSTHKSAVFDMQLDGKGATGTYTFKTAGTFHYFCDRHPGMEADVDVS